jgi:O-antigen/teichoic acid export membrane protein
MNTDRKIFLNTTYQILGKILTSGIGILSTIFLTRYLDVKGFGEYSIIFTYTNFSIIFADFGLGTLLTREVAAKRHSPLFVAQIFSLRLCLSILVSALSIFVLLFLSYSTEVKFGILLSFIGIIFLQLAAIFWAHFQAEFNFKKIVFSQIVVSCITLITTIIGIVFHFSLLFFVFAQVLGAIIGFIVAYYLFSAEHKLLEFNKSLIKEIIIQAWPLGFGAIISVAYFKIDAILLSYFYNPAYTNDFSLYSVSYKPFEVTTVFGGFFIQTLFPLFSSSLYTSQFKKIFSHYFLYTLVLSVSISAGLFFFAPLLIQILGGEKYILATTSLKILSIAAGLSIVSGFFSAIALSAHKQKQLLYISIIACIINIGLNVLVLPKYSFVGASWTTVITQLIIVLLSLVITLDVVNPKKT